MNYRQRTGCCPVKALKGICSVQSLDKRPKAAVSAKGELEGLNDNYMRSS
ncbi:MAG TPA: hypothetical protein VIP70_00875 [Nitrososphaeraceae archaeon]